MPSSPADNLDTSPSSTPAAKPRRKPNIAKSPIVRALLVVASFICLGLAALGVVLPLLPTTPFIILAAYLYSKSSERWYYWLVNHRLFGPPLRRWQETGAITPRAKFLSLAMIAVTFGFSIGFVIDKLFVKIVLVVIALGVSTFIYRLPESDATY